MQIESQNKKVLITGASRGIGKAIAHEFKDSGAYIIGTSTRKENSNNNLDEHFCVDFLDQCQLSNFANTVKSLEPDILINNAGINKIDSFATIPLSDFQNINQVNITAPFLLCQSVIPSMINKKWGRIVNISSIWGIISKEYRASYSASKHGLDGMTLALSIEHSKDGILANCVAPGFTDTELTRKVLGKEQIKEIQKSIPIGRLAATSEIAKLVLWLSSEENTYITGQNIAIDGGFSRA
jgi:3-oxoacyl-[acyl-carrier protein] reductase